MPKAIEYPRLPVATTCTACGAENDDGRRFCDQCGTSLAPGCPSCGAQNRPEARFCGSCGTALSAASGAVAPGASPAVGGGNGDVRMGRSPEGVAERRLVSVLFADLVAFTAYAEGRDPEQVRDVLSRYFDATRTVIERHGGRVEKFIGDAVMAEWGAPRANEDDAERAVRAALEVVEAVRGLGEGLEPRIGVLTGQAAVTLGAEGQGMVAGDLVNTAARLQGVAPPGTVLVGEATMTAAASAIAFEPAGEQLLKGKSTPVPAWRALRVIERPRRSRAQRRSRAALRRARARAATVEGPPSRDRRRAAAAARVDHRTRGHRQEPPRVGAREVHRRARRGRLLASRSRAVVRRWRHVLGARRDGPPPRGPR